MEKDELTFCIIGCAMEVHNQMGPGFQEVIYQRCLDIEFKKAGLVYQGEQAQALYYKQQKVGVRRADFIVGSRVVVELKALATLENVHIVQAKNYTVVYDYPLGLLINFGAQRLEYKLIFNPNNKNSSIHTSPR